MSEQTSQSHPDSIYEQELLNQRREKLQKIKEQRQAFPNDFRRDTVASELHDQYANLNNDALGAIDKTFKVAGRMMLRRVMGKASFATIQDASGRIQLYVRRDDLKEGVYFDFKQWDLGDIVGAEGTLFKTKTGELSLAINAIQLLSKSIRPLPEKHKGLTDVETRYRQRYLDLIANESSRDVFVTRSKIVEAIRQFFNHREFMEVETPMMQMIPGGATAKPFITHHNALDMQLYLRVAPELYLKRLIVGGFEKIYEINRNFRNEGLSAQHNPEFTMLEFYQTYADYHDLMDFTEELFKFIAKTVCQTDKIIYQGKELDFGQPFKRLALKQAVLDYNPDLNASDVDDFETLKNYATKLGVSVKDSWGIGKIQLEIFEKTGEHLLEQPTFITQFPTEVSPLARQNDANPEIVDRFELFIVGREIANGFSELNDPEEQARRFHLQVQEKDSGDDEAMHFDNDYIVALEHGMPPTAGEGIGIDRLVMLFTDSPSIRDVLLFPYMRFVYQE